MAGTMNLEAIYTANLLRQKEKTRKRGEIVELHKLLLDCQGGNITSVRILGGDKGTYHQCGVDCSHIWDPVVVSEINITSVCSHS